MVSPKLFAIIGACWGDEAKGKLSQWLCVKKYAKICVRFNGGSNAGHTIVKNGISLYTHLIPSGIVEDDIMCVIGCGLVVNLKSFRNEINELTEKGIKNIIGRLKISDKAHITLQLHCAIDKILNGGIGTTNQGVGPTYTDKYARIGIRFDNLEDENLNEKIKSLYEIHSHIIEKFNNEHPDKKIDSDALYQEDIKIIADNKDMLIKMVCNTENYLQEQIHNSKYDEEWSIIFEGANAIMLDINRGTYPYVTSSSCDISGILSGTGLNMDDIQGIEMIGVFKSYLTRVGGGCLLTEDKTSKGKSIQTIGKEEGVTTKRLRRCGDQDLFELLEACKRGGFKYLNIAKLDVLSSCENNVNHNVCIGYNDENGNPIKDYPSNEKKLAKATPIYKEFDGWVGFDISKCKTFDELHPNIKTYLKFIEDYIADRYKRIPIKYINTGADEEQMIIRNDV